MHDAEMREADVRWMPFTICAFSPPRPSTNPETMNLTPDSLELSNQQSSHFRRSNLLR